MIAACPSPALRCGEPRLRHYASGCAATAAEPRRRAGRCELVGQIFWGNRLADAPSPRLSSIIQQSPAALSPNPASGTFHALLLCPDGFKALVDSEEAEAT